MHVDVKDWMFKHMGQATCSRMSVMAGVVVVVAGLIGLGVSQSAWAQQEVQLTDTGWQVAPSLDVTTAEGQLAEAKRAFALGEYRTAKESVERWLKEYPNHPSAADAYLLLGDATNGMDQPYQALFEYETVIRLFPGSEQFSKAIEREYYIAVRFLNGEKRNLWGMKLLGVTAEGAEVLIRIQERVPGTALAEQAMFDLADHYYSAGEMFLASEAYDLILLNYPDTTRKQYVMLRLVLSYLAQFKGPAYDVTSLLDAGQWLERFEQDFPAAAGQLGAVAFRHRIDEAMARKQYDTATWYIRRGETVSAVFTLNALLEQYPATTAAIDAVAQLKQIGPVPGTPNLVGQDEVMTQ